MSRAFPVFGMGNPLLDICARVDNKMLEKYDLKPNDAILADKKHLPLYKELVELDSSFLIAGGATQNALRGLQRLTSPNSTVFVGCVSDDDYSQKLKEAAEKDGLKTYYMIDKSVPTGTCATLISGNNRSLVANLSAANNYKVEHLKQPEIWSLVEGADLYYISGFFLTVSVESILEVAQHSLKNNKTFCMNLSAPFIPQFYKNDLEKVLPYCDVLFGNESEALSFAESFGLEIQDVQAIANHLSQYEHKKKETKRIVVITQGSEPTIVSKNGESSTYQVTKLEESEINDTNGAGDAFVGGFLSEFIKKSHIDTCVKAGNWLSKIVIGQAGPYYPPEKLEFKE